MCHLAGFETDITMLKVQCTASVYFEVRLDASYSCHITVGLVHL